MTRYWKITTLVPLGKDFLSTKDVFTASKIGGLIQEVTIPKGVKLVRTSSLYERFTAERVNLGERILLWEPEVIQSLIDNGADVHAANSFALRLAVVKNLVPIVEVLLDNGANIHIMGDWPLRHAAENGNIGMVKLLIKRGANVHACNEAPIRYASDNGHIGMVELLISHGADVHACDWRL